MRRPQRLSCWRVWKFRNAFASSYKVLEQNLSIHSATLELIFAFYDILFRLSINFTSTDFNRGLAFSLSFMIFWIPTNEINSHKMSTTQILKFPTILYAFQILNPKSAFLPNRHYCDYVYSFNSFFLTTVISSLCAFGHFNDRCDSSRRLLHLLSYIKFALIENLSQIYDIFDWWVVSLH